MVVEKDADIEAIEKSGAYKGRYVVLGGTRTLSGNTEPPFEKNLFTRVQKEFLAGTLTEVILALSATVDAEYTTDDIKDRLANLYPTLTISVLGRGLSTGSELEYADPRTLESALKNRG